MVSLKWLFILIGLIMPLSFQGVYAVTLDVFGNSNMDDTIDVKDIAGVEDMINGTVPVTRLADANFDGTVDRRDISEINLIIQGKEKNLTFIDIFGDPVTVRKPLNRIASIGYMGPQILRLIGAQDRLLPVVGGDKSKNPVFWGDISKWHAAGGTSPDIDYEYLLSLNPDAVQSNLEMQNYVSDDGRKQKKEFGERMPGVPVINLNAREPDNISRSILIYGYLFDKQENARKFVDWFEKTYSKIKSISANIPDDKKPKVLFNSHEQGYKYTAGGSRYGQAVRLAGGRNLVDEVVKSNDAKYGATNVEMDPEWVIKEDPDYIFTAYLDSNSLAGFETDNTTGASMSVQNIMNLSAISNVMAVRNHHVYYIDNYLVGGGGLNLVGAAFMGKAMHPDEFKDVDPREILKEYTAFYNSDFNPEKDQGVFIYPPLN
jgi:iron complex transport system substrate-binding protein